MDERVVPISVYLGNIEKYAVPQAICILGRVGKAGNVADDYLFTLQDEKGSKGLICRIKLGAKTSTSKPLRGIG